MTITAAVVLVGAVIQPAAPAGAAFGPNLIVNGSFEIPKTLTGTASPPFGTCGALVPLDLPGVVTQQSFEGCWSQFTLGGGGATVDRTAAKGGKQSVFIEPVNSFLLCLTQAVVATEGTYRLQFWAASSTTFAPFSPALWALSAGAIVSQDGMTFGPVAHGGELLWALYTVKLVAPPGTDHVVVAICGSNLINGFPNSPAAYFDVVTLKQQL